MGPSIEDVGKILRFLTPTPLKNADVLMDGPYVKVTKWQPGIVNDALNYCSYIHILRKGTSKNIVQFLGVTFELGVIIS